jgi:hypothetical protein
VRILYAIEADSAVVRNHGVPLPQKEAQERAVQQNDSLDSNVTQDLAVVRRHDGSVLNDMQGSVRKEFVRQNDTNHTPPRRAALEVDARANVILRDAWDKNAVASIEHQTAGGVVRGVTPSVKNGLDVLENPGEWTRQAELLEPSKSNVEVVVRGATMVNGRNASDIWDSVVETTRQPELVEASVSAAPDHSGLSDSMVYASFVRARQTLAQLRQHIAVKMHVSDVDVLGQALFVALVIIILAILLLAAKVALARYRERLQWAQSHNVAMMRSVNTNTSARNRLPGTASPANTFGRTPSVTRNSNSHGRRMSTGSASSRGSASVRSLSGRRSSIDR